MSLSSGLATSAYRRAATAVHPNVAVVRLYDEVILAIRQALRAFADKAHETAYARVVRAATILRGLDHSLDHAAGGEVAERLHRVYGSYILALHVNYGRKDVARRYGRLLEGLIELRDAWASVAGMRSLAELGAPSEGEAVVAHRAPPPQRVLGRDEIDLMQLALVCRHPPQRAAAPPSRAAAPGAPPAKDPRAGAAPRGAAPVRPAITRAPPKRPDRPTGKPR